MLRRNVTRFCRTINRKMSTETKPVQDIIKESFDNALKTYHMTYNNRTRKFIMYSTGILATTGITGFIFREDIYRYIGGKSSKIVQKTIQDEELLNQANILTQKVTSDLIKDKQTLDTTVNFLLNIMKEEQTKNNLAVLLQETFKEPSVIEGLNDLIKEPSVLKSLQDLLIYAFSDEEVIKQAIVLTQDIFKDPETQLILQNMVIELLQREEMVQVGKEYLIKVIQDETTKQVIVKSIEDILESCSKDSKTHKAISDLISGSAFKLFIPSILS